MREELNYFFNTYEISKKSFLSYLRDIENKWGNSEHIQFPVLKDNNELTIDAVVAHARKKQRNLLILTTGLHGIEGYVGSAMLSVFINQYLDKINPDHTGLVLIHSLNPFGMHNLRRFNENNVDLNRNFISLWNSFDKSINSNYNKLNKFFYNEKKIKYKSLNKSSFYFGLIKSLFKVGVKNFQSTPLLGQYEFKKGIYYGGLDYEQSSLFMINLYKSIVSNYKKIIHIDLHTGYGPRYNMSVVNSPFEKRSSKEMAESFKYSNVIKAEVGDFYKIEGDMLDYFYKYMSSNHPNQYYYGTCFEFGTYGDSLFNMLRSLRAIINENKEHWNKNNDEEIKKYINKEFLEQFYPNEEKWRLKAVEDFQKALEGILVYEKIIK